MHHWQTMDHWLEPESDPVGTVLSLSGADAQTAQTQTSAAFSEVAVRFEGLADIDFRLMLSRSAHLTLGQMSYGDATAILGPPMLDWYHLNLPMTGCAHAEQNGRGGDVVAGARGIAFQPSSPLKVDLSDGSWQYHVKVPRTVFEKHAAALAGIPEPQPVDLDVLFDLDSARGASLVAAVRFLLTECARPGGLGELPLVVREYESGLLTQILTAIPNSLSERINHRSATSQRSRVDRVLDYIDEHTAADLTSAELARVAGCSLRSLQSEFRDRVGKTPSAYVREVRLDRAHADLQAGGAVSDVAMRWGFHHLGRFSGVYKARFGVAPSETTRRARCGRWSA